MGEGNGNPLQYSRLENPMDREPWESTVHGVTRVRHDLVTKPADTWLIYSFFISLNYLISEVLNDDFS